MFHNPEISHICSSKHPTYIRNDHSESLDNRKRCSSVRGCSVEKAGELDWIRHALNVLQLGALSCHSQQSLYEAELFDLSLCFLFNAKVASGNQNQAILIAVEVVQHARAARDSGRSEAQGIDRNGLSTKNPGRDS